MSRRAAREKRILNELEYWFFFSKKKPAFLPKAQASA
jgi:hypothetical protein